MLACTLKAEGMLTASPEEELDAVKRYRESVESSVGGDVVDKVRRDKDSLVDESLEVKF